MTSRKLSAVIPAFMAWYPVYAIGRKIPFA